VPVWPRRGGEGISATGAASSLYSWQWVSMGQDEVCRVILSPEGKNGGTYSGSGRDRGLWLRMRPGVWMALLRQRSQLMVSTFDSGSAWSRTSCVE
jgi:hypothetical protein